MNSRLQQMKVIIKGVFIAIDKGKCVQKIRDEFDICIEALVTIDIIEGNVVIKS